MQCHLHNAEFISALLATVIYTGAVVLSLARNFFLEHTVHCSQWHSSVHFTLYAHKHRTTRLAKKHHLYSEQLLLDGVHSRFKKFKFLEHWQEFTVS